MTPEQIEELAQQIVTQGLPIDWKVYAVMSLLALLGAAIGAAIAGYYSKRGEIKAIHDQIDKVEVQTQRITNIVEREKSLAWVEQKRWDLKRDFYWKLLAEISALSIALRNLHNVFKLEDVDAEELPHLQTKIQSSVQPVQEHQDALLQVLGIGRILLAEDVVALLDSYHHDLREMEKHAFTSMRKHQYLKQEIAAMNDIDRAAYLDQFIKTFPRDFRKIIDDFRNKHARVLPEVIKAARKDLLSL